MAREYRTAATFRSSLDIKKGKGDRTKINTKKKQSPLRAILRREECITSWGDDNRKGRKESEWGKVKGRFIIPGTLVKIFLRQ